MEMLASLYWTPGFLQRFEQSRGYSLIKYLPLLYNYANTWVQTVPAYSEQYTYSNSTDYYTEKHNVDYRITLNEGYQEYIQQFEEWSHSRSVEYSNQPAYNLPLEMVSANT